MNFIFDPSLVLYLPLHELNGTTFMSREKHGYLCTVTGALWTLQGRSFDGVDDQIYCGADPIIAAITGDFTFEAWTYSSTGGEAGLIGNHYAKNDLTSPQDLYFWASRPALVMANGAAMFFAVAPAEIDWLNRWLHVVGTIAGNAMSLYVDGNLEGSNTFSGTRQSGIRIYVGTHDSSARFLHGYIGEVRIYSRALSPLEIQRNYLTTKWRYR